MNLSRLAAVVGKEFLEMRRNRLLLWTIGLPPLALTLLPPAILLAVRYLPAQEVSPEEISGFAKLVPQLTSFSTDELMELFLLRTFLTIFLLLPLVLPLTIAAHSIIGEKQLRTLEPLLSTPITTAELLLGKSLAAVAPAVVATWLAYAVFFSTMPWFVSTPRVYRALLEPTWLLAAVALSPLLSLLSVSCGVAISARVNDPRSTQSVSVLLILPVISVVAGQAVGWFLLDLRLLCVGSALVALVDAAILYAGVLLFDRETILTRWK